MGPTGPIMLYRLVGTRHLSCKSPTLIAHVTEDELRAALHAVDGPDVEAIVQFGANLPMAGLAAEAERWLGKPVIAVNSRPTGTRCAATASWTWPTAAGGCSGNTRMRVLAELEGHKPRLSPGAEVRSEGPLKPQERSLATLGMTAGL